jgi:hypothetical protein
MYILPLTVRPVPSALPDSPLVLTARVTFFTPHAATRKDTFVRVESLPGEDDDALFTKALDEYRRLHGSVCRVVAIDLYPNQ